MDETAGREPIDFFLPLFLCSRRASDPRPFTANSHDMINEPFATGSSVIHRIDPRYKIVIAGLYSAVVAVSYRFPTLASALFCAFILLALARLDPLEVAKRILVVFGFLVLIWLVLPITYEGEPIARIGPFEITRPGVVLCAQITLKSVAILICLISLTTTASFAALGHAMDRLHVPGKIVHLVLMTYRYIFVLEQEFQRLVRAAKIRGFTPGTNIHTYRTYAYLVGMLFVRAASRAERVFRAMRCRGFNGRFYCLADFPPHPRNLVFALLMSAAICSLGVMEWIQPLL